MWISPEETIGIPARGVLWEVGVSMSSGIVRRFFLWYSGGKAHVPLVLLVLLICLSNCTRSDECGTRYPATSGDGYITIETDPAGTPLIRVADGETTVHVGTSYPPAEKVIYSRAFLPLETGEIPDLAEITAASLWIYVPPNGISGNPTLRVVRTDQADTAALASGDYEKCEYSFAFGKYKDSAVRGMSHDISRISEGWNEIPLNEEGIAWINLFGVTQFGLREVDYDCAHKKPQGPMENRVVFHSSRGDNPPYLSITYTLEPADYRYSIENSRDLYCEKNNGPDGSSTNGVILDITADPFMDSTLSELAPSSGKNHYSLVNDHRNSTYLTVKSTAEAKADLFGFDNVQAEGTIHAVTIYCKYRAGKSGAVPPTGRALIGLRKRGVYESTLVDLETDGNWHTVSFTWDTNPKTKNSWKWEQLRGEMPDCVRGGVRFKCALNSKNDFVECSKIWMVVSVKQLLLGKDKKGDTWDIGLRFKVRKFPQGDHVAYARFILPLSHVHLADSLKLIIRGEKGTSSDNFFDGNRPSQRIPTAASVVWELNDGNLSEDRIDFATPYPVSSPDIAPIINEMLAQSRWDKKCRDKTVTLFIDDDGSPAGSYVHAVSFRRLLEETALELYETVRDCIIAKEIVCRVTDTSAVINCISIIPLDMKVEYTLASDVDWKNATTTHGVTVREPTYGDYRVVEETVPSLTADAHYKYRILYRKAGEGNFITSDAIHTFHTQRSPGSSFTFTVEADTHLAGFAAYSSSFNIPHSIPFSSWFKQLYRKGIQAIDDEDADFHVNLGDWGAWCEDTNGITKESAMLFYIRFRQFQGTKAWPMYFVIGNHEGENPARFNHLYPDNLRDGRRHVIPNPTQDGGAVEAFYKTPGDRDSYFAWEWGDALFIALDPFGYCEKNVDDDAWNWTLGETQYNWMWGVLSNSDKKYKFVFTHHLVGGKPDDRWNYGKGGIEYVKYSVKGNPTFEWGGENSAGKSEYKSGGKRDTDGGHWSHGSIHDMFVAHQVTAVFKGHDHVYVEQELDGIRYITCPTISTPSTRNFMYSDDEGFYAAGDYSEGTRVDNYGYVKVTVDAGVVTVSYIGNIREVDRTDTYFSTYQQGAVRRSFSFTPYDADSDGIKDAIDNCPTTPNPDQEDTYPPQGNGIGDACDCEGDFNSDGSVDALDLGLFSQELGKRTLPTNPCTNENPCNGDFDCNGAVDEADKALFSADFGRAKNRNPCPPREEEVWCSY